MKNLLLIIIFITLGSYYFVPNDIKTEIFEKVGIEGSIFLIENDSSNIEKGEIINLKFDKTTNNNHYNGNISNGVIIKDSSWASLPYVKCFYPENNNKFSGNTVFHRILLLKNKDISVKLVTDSDLNMYVYKTDAFSDIYPPEKDYVYDCTINTTVTNRIIDMKGNTAPSDIVIGVVGNEGALEGNYSLELEQK